MTPVPGAEFAVEVHPAGWKFPATPAWVAGWLRLGPNDAVSDLRAWIDHRPHWGLFGLPRGTITDVCRSDDNGFSFLLLPPRGSQRLRLEYRNLAGVWTDFFVVDVRADPASPPMDRPALSPFLAAAIPELLIRRRRRPDQPAIIQADNVVAARLAKALNVTPGALLTGALEEPAEFGRMDHRRLAVTGWLAHHDQPIVRIVGRVDPLRESELTLAPGRPDILDRFPVLRADRVVTFAGLLDFPSGLERPALLTIIATLSDGQRVLTFAQRFREHPDPDVPGCPEATRMDYVRAGWALYRAARRQHLSAAGTFPATTQAWKSVSVRPPRVAPTATRRPVADQPLRAVLVTHNLNYEGAPRLLLELATHFRAHEGCEIRVVSPRDGPLRAVYEAEGIAVEIVNPDALLASVGSDSFPTEAARVADQARLQDCDIVIANTLASFWAIHAALSAGKPSVFYVHESTPPARFFADAAQPGLAASAALALERADQVVFTARASQRAFSQFDHGHFTILPSWLDGEAIRKFVASNPRDSFRAKHGLAANALVVLNLGTVCERKGQLVMVRAVELLEPIFRARDSGRPVVFALVGARDDAFGRQVGEAIVAAGLASIRLIPETRENFDFHRLADLLVCTSFEESSPRVLLEAARFGTPIVTTDVNGIPELLSGREAHLVPAGDAYLLADAIRRAVDEVLAGDRQRANRASATVSARHDHPQSLPHHAALVRAVAFGSAGLSTRR